VPSKEKGKGKEKGEGGGVKKPRSAYNFFCSVKTPELKTQHPDVLPLRHIVFYFLL